MMHPDQMYQLRHLRHHDLRMEAEHARTAQELATNRRSIAYNKAGMTMLAITIRYARYIMSALATVGFAKK
jgi:hypothetical protein